MAFKRLWGNSGEMAVWRSEFRTHVATEVCRAAMATPWLATEVLTGVTVAFMSSLEARGATAAATAEDKSAECTVSASLCCRLEIAEEWVARALLTAAKAASVAESSLFKARAAATSLDFARGATAVASSALDARGATVAVISSLLAKGKTADANSAG